MEIADSTKYFLGGYLTQDYHSDGGLLVVIEEFVSDVDDDVIQTSINNMLNLSQSPLSDEDLSLWLLRWGCYVDFNRLLSMSSHRFCAYLAGEIFRLHTINKQNGHR
jgi:hypothetical protein